MAIKPENADPVETFCGDLRLSIPQGVMRVARVFSECRRPGLDVSPLACLIGGASHHQKFSIKGVFSALRRGALAGRAATGIYTPPIPISRKLACDGGALAKP